MTNEYPIYAFESANKWTHLKLVPCFPRYEECERVAKYYAW